MANFDLSMSNFLVPGLRNYQPKVGKIKSLGVSLTTLEVVNNMATPYTRVFTMTDGDTLSGPVEADCTVIYRTTVNQQLDLTSLKGSPGVKINFILEGTGSLELVLTSGLQQTTYTLTPQASIAQVYTLNSGGVQTGWVVGSGGGSGGGSGFDVVLSSKDDILSWFKGELGTVDSSSRVLILPGVYEIDVPVTGSWDVPMPPFVNACLGGYVSAFGAKIHFRGVLDSGYVTSYENQTAANGNKVYLFDMSHHVVWDGGHISFYLYNSQYGTSVHNPFYLFRKFNVTARELALVYGTTPTLILQPSGAIAYAGASTFIGCSFRWWSDFGPYQTPKEPIALTGFVGASAVMLGCSVAGGFGRSDGAGALNGTVDGLVKGVSLSCFGYPASSSLEADSEFGSSSVGLIGGSDFTFTDLVDYQSTRYNATAFTRPYFTTEVVDTVPKFSTALSGFLDI